ncbi:hypothetical protein FRC04_005780 [Tulasnella sp. 424]|nr:hypothetical protein FRC04_005780 [Tulasnella sp. 424]
MRLYTTIFAIATSFVSVSALVARVGPEDYPSCSIPCFTNADTGSCTPTDNACLCQNNPYLRSTTDCIQSSCSAADLQTATVVARQLCSDAGVNIATNPDAQPTSSSAGPSATGSTSSNTGNSNVATAGSVVDKSALLITGFAVAAAILVL